LTEFGLEGITKNVHSLEMFSSWLQVFGSDGISPKSSFSICHFPQFTVILFDLRVWSQVMGEQSS
jgi:hypothetical protein